MKGSVKSQLNYADIHQSPVVKCFCHKILRLLSAVTNEVSHNPGGLKELETSPFLYHVSKTTWCAFRAPSHHAPKLLSGAVILRTGSENVQHGFKLPRLCPIPSHLLLLTNVVTMLIQISI